MTADVEASRDTEKRFCFSRKAEAQHPGVSSFRSEARYGPQIA
jgi:hypothetical protein